jgi:pyrroloquinoline quinone biosynthesis protein D
MALSVDSRPVLWRLARVRYDDVRQRPVLLFPEGALLLNATAAEILELCDGERTIADIAAVLGAKYQADVSTDVIEYLSILDQRELVHDVTHDAEARPGG